MSFKTHNYFLGNIPHDNHFSNVSSQKTITTSLITNAINKMKPSTNSETTTPMNYLVASPDQLLQTVIDKASDLFVETKQPVVIYALPGIYSDETLNIKAGISIVADSFANLNLTDLTLNGVVSLTNIIISVNNIHIQSTGLGLILDHCRIIVLNDTVSLDLSLLSSTFIDMTNSFFGNENNISIRNAGNGILNMTLTNSQLYGRIDILGGSGQLNLNSSEFKGKSTGLSVTNSIYLINIMNCRLWTNINVNNGSHLYLFNCVLEKLDENNPVVSGNGIIQFGNLLSPNGITFDIGLLGQIYSYVTSQLG